MATQRNLNIPRQNIFIGTTNEADYRSVPDDAFFTTPCDQPAKLIRLPYSTEFYVCTCGCIEKDDCTCDQETVLVTTRNPHTVSPEFVQWLATQTAPFSIEQAAEQMGLSEPLGKLGNYQMAVRVAAFKELTKCGARRDEATKLFISPSAETLSGLNLRRPARNQSSPEAPQLSQESPVDRRVPLPAPHADRQSSSVDSGTEVDQPAPQRSA